MSKYYFREKDSDSCHSKEYFLKEMKENNINQLTVFEAKRMTNFDYFYCQKLGQVAEVGSCDSFCGSYKPLNNKKGRCVNYGYCYENTFKEITLKLKK